MVTVLFRGAWKLVAITIFFFSLTIYYAIQSTPLSLPLTVGISLICMLITAFCIGELCGIMAVIQSQEPELPELTDVPQDLLVVESVAGEEQ